jgi:hypothetical protein
MPIKRHYLTEEDIGKYGPDNESATPEAVKKYIEDLDKIKKGEITSDLEQEESSLAQYEELRKGFEKTIMQVLKGEKREDFETSHYRVACYRIDVQDLIRIDFRRK